MLFDRGLKPPGQNAHGRFSSNQDQVCPYSTIGSGFNTDKRYKSEFHHLVEFDRGQKPSGQKGNIQFSGNPYRVCPYPTTKGGFNSFLMFFTQVQFFQVGFTGW